MKVVSTSRDGCVGEISNPPDMLGAYIYDFDINGTTLKRAHKKWLDNGLTKPILARIKKETDTKWVIYLQAATISNSIDTSDRDRSLGYNRLASVWNYIKLKLKHPNIQPINLGMQSRMSIKEWPFDRRAYVSAYAYPKVKTKASSSPRKPSRTPTSPTPQTQGAQKKFKLRIAGLKSVSFTIPGGPAKLSAGITEHTVFFEICDIKSKKIGLYIYSGGGKTLGWGPVFSGNVSFKGPPNDFSTPSDVGLKDFAGIAMLDSWSINYIVNSKANTTLSFGNPKSKWSLRLRFEIKNLKTGRTVGAPGAGISESIGEMKLIATQNGRF